MISFVELMTLERQDEDRFVAPAAHYSWGSLYGGHLVGQALRAASATVAPDFAVNSLHAYYLRPAEVVRPVALTVERVRDGRRFSARSVMAAQDDRVVAKVLASFHVEEGEIDRQMVNAPAAEAPDSLESNSWSSVFDRRYVPTTDPAQTLAWVGLREQLPVGDRQLHACAIAFLADDLFDDPVICLLGAKRETPDAPARGAQGILQVQSIDYAIWFHRTAFVRDWLLHDVHCLSVANDCATAAGEVFDGDGLHLATIAQQLVVRPVSAPQ